MHKNILLTILITFIVGCSSTQPKQAPDWYTKIPQDSKLLYAVGSAKSIDEAKDNAINSMRETLSLQLNELFRNKNHPLQPIDETTLNKIFIQNLDISKKISFNSVKIEKHKSFNAEELVLISTPKIDIFSKLKVISEAKYKRVKQESDLHTSQNDIYRFLILEPLVDEYATIASLTQYKKLIDSTYDASDEFKFLKDLQNEYDDLKNSINVYILTDVNSKIFSSSIKDAFTAKGISTNNTFNTKNSLKLLVTSTTKESQNYSFNKSQSLVKTTTFDSNNNKLSFRQHTFIGNSRKSYLDAKKQTAANLKYKIDRFGIFDFIGIKQ